MARRAHASAKLLAQVNAMAAGRAKHSDGWIGDSAHASRKSDHNPNQAGVVVATDFTHDPKGGFDSYAFAEHLRQAKDKRIKYVISNGKIFNGQGGSQPWSWRPYSGSNKHDHHVHISLRQEPAFHDDDSPWAMPA
jgi:hypothetical protein